MEAAEKKRMTAGEYLAWEREADVKHEFLDGEVFSMAGGSARHSRLAVRIASKLDDKLSGHPCQVYNSDMRLKVQELDFYAYPGAQVVCDPRRFEDNKEDVLLNPKIIIEVLSPSTASWDRGGKFWHYRHIPSFEEYVVVAQDAWLIEHHTRQPNGGWLLEVVEGQDAVLRLASIGLNLPLAEIYGGTDLPPDAKPSAPTQTKSPDRRR